MSLSCVVDGVASSYWSGGVYLQVQTGLVTLVPLATSHSPHVHHRYYTDRKCTQLILTLINRVVLT